MCLIVDENYPKQVDGVTRWKFLQVIDDELHSPYIYDFVYKKGWNKAEIGERYAPDEDGFHVYTDKERAMVQVNYWSKDAECYGYDDKYVAVKLEVRGFLAGSTLDNEETWREVKIVKFFDRAGKQINWSWNE